MSLISQLRLAAHQATEIQIEFGGGDTAELVAVAEHVAARENCRVESTVLSGQPALLRLRFQRRADDAPHERAAGLSVPPSADLRGGHHA